MDTMQLRRKKIPTLKNNIEGDGKCMFTSPLHSTRQNMLHVSATKTIAGMGISDTEHTVIYIDIDHSITINHNNLVTPCKGQDLQFYMQNKKVFLRKK